MEPEEINEYKKAGAIAKEAVNYAKSIIKPNMLLLDLAEKIEEKIFELGGKPAFPVNLSIDEIAAHSTPSWDDKSTAKGLLKIDIGVHLNGYIADTAFSIDLEGKEENRKLIEASQEALLKALQKADLDVKMAEVGKIIEKTISSSGFQSIKNLTGHSIERYNLHAGTSVPNFDNSAKDEFLEGAYAIEPFSTNGLGAVKDGKPSNIFSIFRESNIRDEFSREVLSFILEEYKTLPFCSRWIYKKFSSRGLLSLKRLEEAGIIQQHNKLIERGAGKVAQSEHTILVTPKEKIITTL